MTDAGDFSTDSTPSVSTSGGGDRKRVLKVVIVSIVAIICAIFGIDASEILV